MKRQYLLFSFSRFPPEARRSDVWSDDLLPTMYFIVNLSHEGVEQLLELSQKTSALREYKTKMQNAISKISN